VSTLYLYISEVTITILCTYEDVLAFKQC